VLETGQRRRSGASVMAGDQNNIGVRLGHPSRDSADSDGTDQLDVDASPRVGIFEVVNQLREVFNRIDVVMRRRRNQPHARRRMPGLSDARVHLETR